ncbi:alpha/beta hydrolase [Ramaria rubella]|nr:alpha/beta hydrolase [Ramaria rubella]
MLLAVRSVATAALKLGPWRDLARNNFSSTASMPIELQYELVKPPSGDYSTASPLVICHGLFGSKQNWRSLSKIFAARLRSDIYSLDLRNHGTSPHSEIMDYSSMASDVLHFFHKHNLRNVSLLGHSMGGKVAMTLALDPTLPPGLLSNLIIADMAPSRGELSIFFRNYTDAMLKVENAKVTTRKEANDIIQEVEPDTSIRAFLLTNLTSAHGGAPLRFRVPVDIIKRSLDNLGDFPYGEEDKGREWTGKTLVIKGGRSKYVNKYNIPLLERFFPNMRLEVLDASHWLHAEKPQDFVDLVVNFVRDV